MTEANEELLRLFAKWTDANGTERAGLELFVAFQRDDETAIDRLHHHRPARTHGTRGRDAIRSTAGRSEVATIIATADPEIAERFTVITRAWASLRSCGPVGANGPRRHRPAPTGEGNGPRSRRWRRPCRNAWN